MWSGAMGRQSCPAPDRRPSSGSSFPDRPGKGAGSGSGFCEHQHLYTTTIILDYTVEVGQGASYNSRVFHRNRIRGLNQWTQNIGIRTEPLTITPKS